MVSPARPTNSVAGPTSTSPYIIAKDLELYSSSFMNEPSMVSGRFWKKRWAAMWLRGQYVKQPPCDGTSSTYVVDLRMKPPVQSISGLPY